MAMSNFNGFCTPPELSSLPGLFGASANIGGF
jgi:hypothetical protein